MWLLYWTILAAAIEPQFRAPVPETILFEERFDSKLREGWSWVDQKPDAWRLEADRLLVRVEPESVIKDESILTRNLPRTEKPALIVEVCVESEPTENFENAGISIFHDERNYCALSREYLGTPEKGRTSLVMGGHKDGKKYPYAIVAWPAERAWLRLIISGGNVTGQARASESDEWKTIGQFTEPSDVRRQVPKQVRMAAGLGPKSGEHWAAFTRFRILEAGQ